MTKSISQRIRPPDLTRLCGLPFELHGRRSMPTAWGAERYAVERGDLVAYVGAVQNRGGQRVVARPCTYCGSGFAPPVRTHQLFCRPWCRWEDFKARRADRAPLEGLSHGQITPSYSKS